jgi:hypothetical protein
LRNGEAQHLSGFEVDDHLELGGLLDRQVGDPQKVVTEYSISPINAPDDERLHSELHQPLTATRVLKELAQPFGTGSTHCRTGNGGKK